MEVKKKVLRVSGDIDDLRAKLREEGFDEESISQITEQIKGDMDDEAEESGSSKLAKALANSLVPVMSMLTPVITAQPIVKLAEILQDKDFGDKMTLNKIIVTCHLFDSPIETVSYENMSMLTQEAFDAATEKLHTSLHPDIVPVFVDNFKILAALLGKYIRDQADRQVPAYVKMKVLEDPQVDPNRAALELMKRYSLWTKQVVQYISLLMVGEMEHAATIEVALLPMGFKPIATRYESLKH